MQKASSYNVLSSHNNNINNKASKPPRPLSFKTNNDDNGDINSNSNYKYPSRKQNFIKIDIQILTIENTKGNIYKSQNSSRQHSIAFLVKYERSEIVICLCGFKYEIIIPFSELNGFKIEKTGKIEMKLKNNYEKWVYYHNKGFPFLDPPVLSKVDPTKGLLNDAIRFELIPKSWEHESTLAVIEAGINRICFLETGKINECTKEQISLVCYFSGISKHLPFPSDGRFADLISKIKQTFDLDINMFEYLDYLAQEQITVLDEEDWEVAKSNAFHIQGTHAKTLKLYFNQYYNNGGNNISDNDY
ncbi:7014_t:CDS:2 [Entrophospora sp. SA101]|nr:7014_t:CDS:2 [Entrophospora sp. SA101]CAJ0845994.1 1538_t:CDS:2 [Entrophospora sp. SA101]